MNGKKILWAAYICLAFIVGFLGLFVGTEPLWPTFICLGFGCIELWRFGESK